MLENSRKRSRKAKLQLREGVELEEASFLYMQVKEELPEDEPNESDVVHDNIAVAEVKAENDLEIDPLQHVAQTRKHKPLMEFSVKVEVEECDITDINGGNAESKLDEERKTDNDVTGVVTVDATSNVFVATSSLKPLIKIETLNKNANERSLLKRDAKEIPELKEYSANKQMILRIVDRLLKSSNVADRTLAIEARNYAGRVLEQVKEVVFKNVLREWNNWCQEHSAVRDSPLLFKCYICGNSYWHLYEFREHVQTHKKLPYAEQFQLTIETSHDECYIIYFMQDLAKKPMKFPDGNCFKCGKPANTHTFADTNIKNYRCEACKLTFSTCTQLSMHEMRCSVYKNSLDQESEELKQCSICESGFYTESTLQKHLSMSHTVRSDIVMTWEVMECLLCMQSFIVAPLHICAKKANNYGCNNCGRSFQKKIYKELHIQNYHKSVQCRVCFKYLTAACMEPSHLLQHTDRYALMYKCLECSTGRYFSDENSIIQHTATVHNRKFEKKFKYLEMVILPKQCLDRVSKHSQTAVNTIEVMQMKVTSEPVGNIRPVTLLKRKLSEESMQVIIKEEPEDSTVNSQICVQAKVIPGETEKIPEIQIADITSLNEQITNSTTEEASDDVIIIEREDDIISLNSSNESYEETTYTPDVMTSTRKKRKKLIKYPCVCGLETTASRLIAHKDRCAVVRARLKRKRAQSTENEENEKPENDTAETSEPPAEDDSDSDYENDDDYDEELTEDHDRVGRRGRPRSRMKYVCMCKFKGNYREFKLHRLECDVDGFVVKRPKKKVLVTCTKCNTMFHELQTYCKHFHKVHGYEKNTCPVCVRQFDCVTLMETDVLGHVKHQFVKIRKINEGLEGTKCIVCKNCQEPVESKDYFSHWESHLTLKDMEEDPGSEKELTIDEDESNLYHSDLMKKILESLQSTDMSRTGRINLRKCVVCFRQFGRVNDSKRHLVEHLLSDALLKKQRLGSLQCQICSKSLPKPDSYKHHMRKHGSLPLYQCELCSKSFSDSSNFCKHKKVHNLAVLRCTTCDKKFQNSVCLAKHMKMHEDTKPTVCEVCSRVFFTRSSYNKHYRSAHERRPRYRCLVCRKSFPRVRDKWDHMWMAHEERQVKADCPLCDHSFRRFSDVRTHVRMVHQRDVRRTNDGDVVLLCDASHPPAYKFYPAKKTKRKPHLGYREGTTVMMGPRVKPDQSEQTSEVNPALNGLSEVCESDMMEIVFKFEEDSELERGVVE